MPSGHGDDRVELGLAGLALVGHDDPQPAPQDRNSTCAPASATTRPGRPAGTGRAGTPPRRVARAERLAPARHLDDALAAAARTAGTTSGTQRVRARRRRRRASGSRRRATAARGYAGLPGTPVVELVVAAAHLQPARILGRALVAAAELWRCTRRSGSCTDSGGARARLPWPSSMPKSSLIRSRRAW